VNLYEELERLELVFVVDFRKSNAIPISTTRQENAKPASDFRKPRRKQSIVFLVFDFELPTLSSIEAAA
jgi:hypothetical protein